MNEREMKECTPKELDRILQDFRESSESEFKASSQQFRDNVRQGGKVVDLYHALFYPNGLVWWNGYDTRHQSLGNPADYLILQDSSPEETQNFISTFLDQGVMMWGPAREDWPVTNPADYICWLHRNCENKKFTQKLEDAVVDLLEKELDRDYGLPGEGPKEVEKWRKTFNKVNGLFRIVLDRGNPENGFRQTAELLEEKARAGWMSAVPEIPDIPKYYGDFRDIYCDLLHALAAVQSNGDLDDFWTDQIRTAGSNTIALTAIVGYFKSQIQQKKEPPLREIMELAEQRISSLPDTDTGEFWRELEGHLSTRMYLYNRRIFNSDPDHVYPLGQLFFERETYAVHIIERITGQENAYTITIRTIKPRAEDMTSIIHYSPQIRAYVGPEGIRRRIEENFDNNSFREHLKKITPKNE